MRFFNVLLQCFTTTLISQMGMRTFHQNLLKIIIWHNAWVQGLPIVLCPIRIVFSLKTHFHALRGVISHADTIVYSIIKNAHNDIRLYCTQRVFIFS